MQLPTPQHYLIKTKTNLAYYFFLNKDRTISVRLFSAENDVIDEDIITPQGIIDFSVTIDSNDNIHMICISNEGALLYYIQQKNQWNHRQISNLDIKSNHYKNLIIIMKNKDTHVFCNKTNLTNPMVTSIEHMYWNDKNINKKTVSNYLPGKYPSPLQLDFDSQGNVHLIYKVLHKSNHQFYYSYFNIFNKKWNNPEMITSPQEDHSHPHMLIDHKDNLHLVWCTIEDNNFTVKYKRKLNVVNFKSKWAPIKTLSDRNANSISPIIIQEGSIIKVLSKQTNQIVETSSDDLGINWSLPSNEKIYKITNPLLVKYLTNHDFEKITLAITYCYCEICESIDIIGASLFKMKKRVNIDENSVLQSAQPPEPPPPNLEESKMQGIENICPPKIDVNEAPEKKKLTEVSQVPEKHSQLTLEIDGNLKTLVQEVQNYINQMIIEVEKLESSKTLIKDNNLASENSIHPPIDTIDIQMVEAFQHSLTSLNDLLMDIENNQLQLQKELNEYQKKIYDIEDRMVYFKKHLMELQDRLNHLHSLAPGFMNRIKSLFKNNPN